MNYHIIITSPIHRFLQFEFDDYETAECWANLTRQALYDGEVPDRLGDIEPGTWIEFEIVAVGPKESLN